MNLSVDVHVLRAHVPLDDHLILLRVLAANHQVVLAGDEPVELLKPHDLAPQLCARLLHLGQLLNGPPLGRLDSLVRTRVRGLQLGFRNREG